MSKKKFPFYQQPDHMDCGPTCIRMIAKYYGKHVSLAQLRKLSETTREGSSLKYLSDAAEHIGFRTLGIKINFEQFEKEVPLPCIVFWQQRHFVVVHEVKKGKVYVADPAHGMLAYSKEEFIKNWIGENASSETGEGIALLFEPTPRLKEETGELQDKRSFKFLFAYVLRHKKFLIQLAIGLLTGSLLQLIFPFLTQSIVDVGIQNQDINFIYLILAGQLFLFFGRSGVELIRGWILLHLSTRINISLISDFFIKLMKLPISFFDVKMTGDLMQRIGDHKRIENLMTTTSLSVLFSFFNILVFGAVLAWYDLQIFTLFFIGSAIHATWIALFLKKRKDLDYKRFSHVSDEQSKIIEMINGMQEIKLHNAEKQKRWNWEHLQARLFKIQMEGLRLDQWQSTGASFINELKNILISILTATLVINNELTLGMMLSVSYITGQLSSPIMQLVGFMHRVQDAKIALERLGEIHDKEDEEDPDSGNITVLPEDAAFDIKDLHFRYKGAVEPVLKGIDLHIPANKVTAIVGASGSGKTTLMKVLLKFYEPEQGDIRLGNMQLSSVSPKAWRDYSGVVMQEGYIFSDTIAQNIAVGEDVIDRAKLAHAVDVANIREFIESLPLAYNTKIGQEGVGLSGGQKQRILIARAVYKNPQYIFFDEATSALDANNEMEIVQKLNTFFKDRTAVVIAHRLSTVKDADQIIVLEDGQVAEQGSHEQLIEAKGAYFNLVKNQLQLERLNTSSKD